MLETSLTSQTGKVSNPFQNFTNNPNCRPSRPSVRPWSYDESIKLRVEDRDKGTGS